MAKKNTKNSTKKDEKVWSAYDLAMNLGFMIVIPILLFGGGGVLLDKKLDTFPLFVLIGFVLSIVSGLTIVYKKTKDIIAGDVLRIKSTKIQSKPTKKK